MQWLEWADGKPTHARPREQELRVRAYDKALMVGRCEYHSCPVAWSRCAITPIPARCATSGTSMATPSRTCRRAARTTACRRP